MKQIAPNTKASDGLCVRCSRSFPFSQYSSLNNWINLKNRILKSGDIPLAKDMAIQADILEVELPEPKSYEPVETDPINTRVNPFFSDIDPKKNVPNDDKYR